MEGRRKEREKEIEMRREGRKKERVFYSIILYFIGICFE